MLLKSKSNYNKFTSNTTFFSLPGNNKKHTADTKACQQHVHPDIRRERVKEGEDSWICAVGFVVEDADSQRHEWLREINNFFPDICDSERGHSKVSHLVKSKNHRQLQTLWRFEQDVFSLTLRLTDQYSHDQWVPAPCHSTPLCHSELHICHLTPTLLHKRSPKC